MIACQFNKNILTLTRARMIKHSRITYSTNDQSFLTLQCAILSSTRIMKVHRWLFNLSQLSRARAQSLRRKNNIKKEEDLQWTKEKSGVNRLINSSEMHISSNFMDQNLIIRCNCQHTPAILEMIISDSKSPLSK